MSKDIQQRSTIKRLQILTWNALINHCQKTILHFFCFANQSKDKTSQYHHRTIIITNRRYLLMQKLNTNTCNQVDKKLLSFDDCGF